MPFKSAKQRRYLWANKPEVAREFADAEKGGGHMPKVGKKKFPYTKKGKAAAKKAAKKTGMMMKDMPMKKKKKKVTYWN